MCMSGTMYNVWLSFVLNISILKCVLLILMCRESLPLKHMNLCGFSQRSLQMKVYILCALLYASEEIENILLHIGFPRLKSLLCIGGTAVRDQIEVLKR